MIKVASPINTIWIKHNICKCNFDAVFECGSLIHFKLSVASIVFMKLIKLVLDQPWCKSLYLKKYTVVYLPIFTTKAQQNSLSDHINFWQLYCIAYFSRNNHLFKVSPAFWDTWYCLFFTKAITGCFIKVGTHQKSNFNKILKNTSGCVLSIFWTGMY